MNSNQYQWKEIDDIVKIAASIEKNKEAGRLPQHPRIEFIEDDLHRAIRILNAAGFVVFEDITLTGTELKPSKDEKSEAGHYWVIELLNESLGTSAQLFYNLKEAKKEALSIHANGKVQVYITKQVGIITSIFQEMEK